jgi:glycerol-3-phosphate cytidylyltransferase
VPQDERLAIVRSMDVVDLAVLEPNIDKGVSWQDLRFDVLFKGSDWVASAAGTALEAALEREGARVIYLPYTEHTSSSLLRESSQRLRIPPLEKDAKR